MPPDPTHCSIKCKNAFWVLFILHNLWDELTLLARSQYSTNTSAMFHYLSCNFIWLRCSYNSMYHVAHFWPSFVFTFFQTTIYIYIYIYIIWQAKRSRGGNCSQKGWIFHFTYWYHKSECCKSVTIYSICLFMYDLQSFTFEHFKFCSTYISRGVVSETNMERNLLYLMILWCCCANFFRFRNVNQDDFMVYKHLLCKKNDAWGGITSLGLLWHLKDKSLPTFPTVEEK